MEGNEMEVDSSLGDALNVTNTSAETVTQLEEDPLGYNPQLNCGYDPELRDDRRANKKKLRRRFEHIFEKYERDFGGVGDEIDLKTGEIVVDNGHLQRMQNEQDIGAQSSSRAVQPGRETAEGSGADSYLEQSDQNGSEDGYSEDEGSESENEDSFVRRTSDSEFSAAEANGDSATSPFDADESALEDDPANGYIKAPVITEPVLAPVSDEIAMPRRRRTSAMSNGSGTSTDNNSSITAPKENLFDQVPGLRESVQTLQSRYKRGQTMDQDAIQALGMSIANQLATFISHPRKDESRRKSKKSRNSAWSFPKLPEDDERKRKRRSPSPQPELTEAPPSGKKSIWAPIRHPRQQKRKRMKVKDPAELVDRDDDGKLSVSDEHAATEQPVDRMQNGEVRKCKNCESSDSDVWRKGPDGDLCNTCGMYFYRYGLMRPVELFGTAEDPRTPEDTEGEMDPLERDWWLACTSASSTKRQEIIKPVGVRNAHFVIDEDALIIQLREIDLLSWERMTAYLPGRSAYALQCRYSKKLRGCAPEARNLLIERGYQGNLDANGVITFTYTRDIFKEEEDELLLKLRDEDGLEWDAVAAALPGRTPHLVELRYHELAEQLLAINADDSDSSRCQSRVSRERSYSPTRSIRYSAEEDAKIVKLREVHKLTWSKIAEEMEGRNSFSLQKRYIRLLCGKHPDSILPPRKAYERSTPALESSTLVGEEADHGIDGGGPSTEARSLINARYSAEEDAMLLDLRDVQRLTWEQIDPKMPSRSRTSLIKRYAYLRGKRPNESQQDPNFEASARLEAEVTARTGFGEEGNESRANLSISALSDQQPRSANAQSPENLNPSAELDGTATLQNEKLFTEHEDGLIVKLREVENLPWPDIAVQMPGRTVPSISQRYYHFLIPRHEGTVQNQVKASTRLTSSTQSVAPDLETGKPAPIKRWTMEEDDLLVMLRDQGESWVEISNRLPGRTAMAAKAHHAAMFDQTKKAYQSRQSLLAQTASKSQPPLLRQAVNNLRRRSESILSLENGEHSPVNLDGQELPGSTGPPVNSLLSNNLSLDKATFGKTPPRVYNSATGTNIQHNHVFDASEPGNGLFPDTPVTGAQLVRSSSVPTPLGAPIYATPSRYNPQGHPYFVFLPASYPLPPEDNPVENAITAEKGAFSEASSSILKAPKITDALKDTKRRNGSNVQKSRKRMKQKHKESDLDTTDDEELTHPGFSDDDFLDEQPSTSDSSESDVEGFSAQEKQDDSERTVDDSEETEVDIEEQNGNDPEESDDMGDERVDDQATNNCGSTEVENAPITIEQGQPMSEIPHRPRGRPRIRPKYDGPPRPRGRPRKVQSERTKGNEGISKPQRKDFVDSNYVKAHPDEVFHHRGRGLWARGLPPSGSSRKIPVRKPGAKEKPVSEDLFDREYVDAHPEETFYHRGNGSWAKGHRPTRSSSKVAMQGTGAKEKQDATGASHDAGGDQNSHAVGVEACVDGAMDTSGSQEIPALESQQVNGDKSMKNNDAPTNTTANGTSKVDRPSLSHLQLATMALQSKAPQPMTISEVYEYVEENFEYFKYSKGWRDGIRGTISRAPQFTKSSTESKSGWVLTSVPVSRKVGRPPGVSTQKTMPPPDATTTQSASAFTTPKDRSAISGTPKRDNEMTHNTLSAVSSDIVKEPQSEADLDTASKHLLDEPTLQDSSEISIGANDVLLSSSPILAKKRSPQTVYGKTSTPDTGSSTLRSNVHKLSSTNRSTPVRAGPFAIPRHRSVAELGNGKRIVHTPLREFDSSEDELAL